jgi:hypothetical protein
MKSANWRNAIILVMILLLSYWVSRHGLPQYYTPEWSARRLFWIASLIVVFPYIFGKPIFSATALAGYLVGMLTGELFGGFQQNLPPHYPHYGWLIQTLVFLLFCLVGLWLQCRFEVGPSDPKERQIQ